MTGRLVESVVRVKGQPNIADPKQADREWEANTRPHVGRWRHGAPASPDAVAPAVPPVRRRYIVWGALTPSRARPARRTSRVEARRASRARRTAGSGLSMRADGSMLPAVYQRENDAPRSRR